MAKGSLRLKHIPAKKKYEWASSAFGKRGEGKRRPIFGYMGKILKQMHSDFSGCSWALRALQEVGSLSFYNHQQRDP
ncbi:histone H2A.N [Artibeus jamaicensis]|uniref:histone H2A.N n=1 Tax=Artibeus jamaicensis TaxID=9417 RepID=UPI00235B0685|nr:histone H2A.N [Artibeus jamaicensis]